MAIIGEDLNSDNFHDFVKNPWFDLDDDIDNVKYSHDDDHYNLGFQDYP